MSRIIYTTRAVCIFDAAAFFFLLVLKPYGRCSEPPGNLKINNRVNFNLYVVPLWVNGNRDLHPSAPLGLLLSVVTKVTKNTLFLRERADPKQLCFAELVSGPTSSFAAIKALLNPTKETVRAAAFPFLIALHYSLALLT